MRHVPVGESDGSEVGVGVAGVGAGVAGVGAGVAGVGAAEGDGEGAMYVQENW